MRIHKLILGGLAAGLAMTAGIAYASIPDSGGVIHGCYKNAVPHKLAVIDTATAPTCPAGYTRLNWPTKGALLDNQWASFNGPYTSGETVASFTVPAGLMCVSSSLSAWTSNPGGGFVSVSFGPNPIPAPSTNGFVFTNEPSSHKALLSIPDKCEVVAAGTYSYTGRALTSGTMSDSLDHGYMSVMVYSN
jgi:hypothetical protein